MRKLFLSSTGLNEFTEKYFYDLLDKAPDETLIGCIPTASDVKENPEYIQRHLKFLIDKNFNIETIDLKDKNQDELYQKLSKVDVINVEGGNTFYLLDWIRKSGFDKIIGKLLDEGKIYFGVSAGSYVTCPTIESATWKHADQNTFNLKDLNGLNLVPFIISAHFNREKYYNALQDGISKTKLPIIALTDQQAIVVVGNDYQVVGEGKRNYFNGFKEIGVK